MSSRKMVYVVLGIFLLAAGSVAFEGTIIFSGASWKPNKGIYLVDVGAGTSRKVYDGGTDNSYFSPDGRRILFAEGGSWYTIKNDGTDKKLFYDGVMSPTGQTGLKWVQSGVFWQESGGAIYRLDPDTKEKRLIATVTGDYYQGLWISHSGSRCVVWTRNNESEHHYPMIDFTSNWDSYSVRWADVWGHGWHLVLDGSHVVVDDWRGVCNSTDICDDYGSHETFLLYDWDNVGPEKTDGLIRSFPSNTEGNQVGTHDVYPVINSNDWFCFMGGGCRWTADENGCDDPQLAWVANWQTGEVEKITAFPDHYMFIGGGWQGALPSPDATTPVISASPSVLSLALDTGTVKSQSVTITNSGVGTLGAIDIAIDPQTATWLSATTGGATGNAQTCSVTVSSGGLAVGSHSATVNLSGGGADNTVSIAVSLTVGSSLAAPTLLTGTVGGTALDQLTLSWTDNTTGEDGFAIERKRSSGTWDEIARVNTNVATYAFETLSPGIYEHRVRAYDATSYSGYSNEIATVVSGIPYITITSPQNGDTLTPGSTIAIQWEANLTELVVLQYSLDGVSYRNINLTGGVSRTSEDWGNFSWQVPDTSVTTLYILVNDYQADDFNDEIGPLVIGGGSPVHFSARAHHGAGASAITCTPEGTALRISIAPDHAIATVALLSLNGRILAQLAPSQGTHSWIVPHVSSTVIVEARGKDGARIGNPMRVAAP